MCVCVCVFVWIVRIVSFSKSFSEDILLANLLDMYNDMI